MIGARALRVALFAALVLALGVLTRPARAASAPFCDDRGATAVAPAPALQASDVTIAADRACPWGLGDPSPVSTASPPRGKVPSSGHAWDAALAFAPFTLTAPRAGRADWPSRALPRGDGVRGRLERPPRG